MGWLEGIASEVRMQARRMTLRYFVFFTLLGFVLYAPFRSNQWDLNGIIEVQAIQAGGHTLFSPNHMLNRPIGFVLLEILRRWIPINNPAEIFQYATVFCASIGLGFAFLASYYLTNQKLAAMIATAFLATSWSNWTFSTDANYICAGSMTVLIVLVLLTSPNLSLRSTWVISFFCALSIFFWQANIFMLPSIIIAFLWLYRAKSLKERLFIVGTFLGILVFVVGLAYILVGMLAYGHKNLFDLITWCMGHGSDTYGRPLLWGKWSIDRIFSVTVSAVGSFIPIWEGLGIRSLLRGEIRIDKILGQLSLVAFLILGAWSLVRFVWQCIKNTRQTDRTMWLIFAYLSYLPFIIWWDPYEPKWFVVPNIFLVLGLSAIWSQEFHANQNRAFFVSLGIIIIAVANFTLTIQPRHSQPNPQIQTAKCFVEFTNKDDLFIPIDWNWFGYATYFFDYKGETLQLMRGKSERQYNLELVETSIHKTHQRGGNVYVIDSNYYSLEQQQWFERELGLDVKIFEQFEQTPAFVCNGIPFMKILSNQQK